MRRLVRIMHSAWIWSVAFVGTGVFSLLAIVVSIFDRSGTHTLVIPRVWAGFCLRLARMDVVVEGFEHVEEGGQYVVMANHASTLDIPVLFHALPSSVAVRFMAKRSLFWIPILGWAMRLIGFVPVDRKRRSTATASFDAATEHLRGGRSIIIFPEQTRTRDGRLQDLKRGGFLLALKTSLPILPIGLEGTREAMPPDQLLLYPRRITVRFGPPVPTSELGISSRRLLTEQIADTLSSLCHEPRKPESLSE